MMERQSEDFSSQGRTGSNDDYGNTAQPDESDQSAEETQIEAELSQQPEQQNEEPANQPDVNCTVESVIEAILFASDEPLNMQRLAEIAELEGAKQVRECIDNLNVKYKTTNAAFRIEQIAGGLQMMTYPAYNHWLKKLVRSRADNKLTPAALETLAIIAYKQPIIRADVEVIRGVACGEMIRGLMYKGLVKIAGRAEVLGRPILYGTTKRFLEIFGLNSLKDLPKTEELKQPQ